MRTAGLVLRHGGQKTTKYRLNQSRLWGKFVILVHCQQSASRNADVTKRLHLRNYFKRLNLIHP